METQGSIVQAMCDFSGKSMTQKITPQPEKRSKDTPEDVDQYYAYLSRRREKEVDPKIERKVTTRFLDSPSPSGIIL